MAMPLMANPMGSSTVDGGNITMSIGLEGQANALAVSKDYNQVVVAGRNVFKVFRIEETEFLEQCNLRVGKNLNLNFSCNHVAWNTVDQHMLATAATNGAVVLWNLNRPTRSKQDHVFNEHKRTVNKVCFHPLDSNVLLSGSQDGTMKCFDVRMLEVVGTYVSNAESVRDVQFSPHSGQNTFSAVAENGTVQLWDRRRWDKFVLQFTAHSGPVFACEWHPEMQWLATASRDKTIKVWDLQVKSTLEFTVHTFASIGQIAWRPSRRYQIASCALVVDCSINVWDVRRPFMPFAAFARHKDFVTGLAWRGSPHLFLSASRDCTLFQHAFCDATHLPLTNTNPQAIAFSNDGHIAHCVPNSGGSTVPATLTTNVITACDVITTNSSAGASTVTTTTISPLETATPAALSPPMPSSSLLHRQLSLTETFTVHASSSFRILKSHNIPNNYANQFRQCAKQYLLTGKPLAEMCDHNAAVAKSLGLTQINLVWQVLKTLYSYPQQTEELRTSIVDNNEPVATIAADNIEQSSSSEGPPSNITEIKNVPVSPAVVDDDVDGDQECGIQQQQHQHNGLGDFFFGDGEIDPLSANIELSGEQTAVDDECWQLKPEAFIVRHEIQEGDMTLTTGLSQQPQSQQQPVDQQSFEGDLFVETNVSSNDSSNDKMLSFDGRKLVARTLVHYVNVEGDVQTAIAMLFVMGERGRRELQDITEQQQELWLITYVELLGRWRLFDVAAEVIRSAWIESVNALSQQSTTIYTGCGDCGKALQRSGWLCDRCHSARVSACAVCHRTVRGLYTWCQGCAHGGHLSHMAAWFRHNQLCPTGCGHACEYT